MKKTALVSASVFVIVAFTVVSLFANAKILKQHKEVKASKTVTKCADCHNDVTKLEKKKGTNYKPLYKTKSCSGDGCHK